MRRGGAIECRGRPGTGSRDGGQAAEANGGEPEGLAARGGLRYRSGFRRRPAPAARIEAAPRPHRLAA